MSSSAYRQGACVAHERKEFPMAMDKNEIESRVLEMLEEICDDEAVREERDVDLFEAGLLDSLAAIEVLVGIEENFGIEIAPTAVERKEMNTVNKIIEQIAVRL